MKRDHVSPEYWVALFDQGMRPEILKALALEIPTFVVFEDVRKRIITPRYATELLTCKRQAVRDAEPWPMRLLRCVFTEKESTE